MSNPPKKVINPWLSKGSSHLLKGVNPKLPTNCNNPTLSNVNSVINNDVKIAKDYFIHSSAQTSTIPLDECLYDVQEYMEEVKENSDIIYKKDGDIVDFSIYEDYQTIGFVNEGNNCYQNSVFQCLLHYPPFFHLLVELNNRFKGVDNPYTPFITLFLRIVAVMKQCRQEDSTSQIKSINQLNLHELRELIAIRNVMFAEEQSDVQEFFLYIVDELSKELNSFLVSSQPTTVSDDEWNEIGSGGRKMIIHEAIVEQNVLTTMFETQLRQEVKSYSKRQYIEQQSYLTLSLPILSDNITSVKDALSLYLSGEYETKHGQYRIECSPPCLVLHLMRFLYNKKLQRPVKLTKSIDFDDSLDLSDFNVYRTAKHTKYELFAIISHQGHEVMNGHYICFCKTMNEYNGWVCCNDNYIRDVSYQEVLHAEPYMLFYRAID